ncbi:MAG: ribonuclease HII [Magnetococcales bacterium]|nr:ribonuclease HII [Magnetococcales bacterium]
MPHPDLHLESALWADNFRLVCGVDEAGRGPLAGPVVAAAVIFPPKIDLKVSGLNGINDSKKLTPLKRKKLSPIIHEYALCVGIGIVSPRKIDEINIRRASLLAMALAVNNLENTPDFVLVDGRETPDDLIIKNRAVIGGDGKSSTIAAASVIAKVTRDNIMADLAKKHPNYGWERNQGYPTLEHKDALLNFGVTEHHRRSFSPVRLALAEEEGEQRDE